VTSADSDPARAAAARRSFVLYTRAGCELCEHLLAALSALPAARGLRVELVDIDADPAARARFGHKIPVLYWAGELVCHGRLDVAEVHKALAHGG
jgi:hypothetical protein